MKTFEKKDSRGQGVKDSSVKNFHSTTESIATAAGWIESYLDVGTPEVRRVLDGLRALEGVDLAAPLLDISGSLTALNAALRPAP